MHCNGKAMFHCLACQSQSPCHLQQMQGLDMAWPGQAAAGFCSQANFMRSGQIFMYSSSCNFAPVLKSRLPLPLGWSRSCCQVSPLLIVDPRFPQDVHDQGASLNVCDDALLAHCNAKGAVHASHDQWQGIFQ